MSFRDDKNRIKTKRDIALETYNKNEFNLVYIKN